MLTRKYGLLTVTMMAISATLGSSILIAFGQVAYQAQYNPILMLLAWIIGAILIIPGLLLFAETTSSYPENGTAYTWLKKAKFQATAFWFGWILVLLVAATAIASATIACGNLIASLAAITNPWLIKLIGIDVLVIMGLTHIYTKKIVGISQTIFTVLKFIPILLVMILAIVYGSLANFEKPEVTKNLHQLFLTSYMLLPAMAMTMFAYSGIEAVTYVAGEIKEPRKNIIRAKIIAILVVVGVYVILAVAIITINISNNLNAFSNNLWSEAILSSKTIPHGFALAFNILSIVIFLGSLNAFLLYHSRMVHKLAQEHDLFNIFSKTNNPTNSPYLAIVLLMLLSSVYVLWDQLYSVVTYFIIATTVLQFIAFSVALKLRYQDSTYKRMFNNFWYWVLFLSTIIGNILCLIGAIISMYVFARDSHDWWILYKCFIVCGVLVAGFPIYYIKEFTKKRMIINKQKQETLKQ
ncbi:amino acid permease [Spiroplasma sp. AdecLV25b]|uniref:APC family permease n=1 Tax=Spiroplasma sp. AdecLV25b TaxID=3027162 RepID=UPI0027E109CE|nr:amino acid permease [Spiroplasma sp. AdecLV25b]